MDKGLLFNRQSLCNKHCCVCGVPRCNLEKLEKVDKTFPHARLALGSCTVEYKQAHMCIQCTVLFSSAQPHLQNPRTKQTGTI